METKNIIVVLLIIVILLAIGLVVEVFVFNNGNNTNSTTTTNNTTLNTEVAHISSDAKNNDQNSIEANRPKNDPNYKGYNPRHEK